MEKTSFPQGDFCWIELSTSDGNSAKKFYTGLFGWSTNEISMGDQPPYVMVQKNGKDVAGLLENKNAPPHWMSYVAVSSADDAAKKAKSLGAKVVAGPFDVMDVGRMAVIQDPQGAMFSLWEEKRPNRVMIVNEAGAMCWNELYTPDIEGSRKFYVGLFDWKLKI